MLLLPYGPIVASLPSTNAAAHAPVDGNGKDHRLGSWQVGFEPAVGLLRRPRSCPLRCDDLRFL
jgi:hypothetical protein